MKHYTYKITNNVNGKYYLGRRSFNNEMIEADSYFGSSKILKRSIRKYGKDSFTKEILEIYDTYEELVEAEKTLITADIVADPLCYNIALGGWGGYTYYEGRKSVLSEEGKQRISEANTGRPRPDASKRNLETGFNKHWAGKTRSEQDKANKSLAAKKNVEAGINPFTQKIKCPHCNKETDTGNAKRWHFDKCKERK